VPILLALAPSIAWGIFSTDLITAPAAATTFLSGFLGPVIGFIWIVSAFQMMQQDLIKNNPSARSTRREQERSFVFANQFLWGQIFAHFSVKFLPSIAQGLTSGPMIAGAPLEAQMLMMVVHGLVFGLTMLAFKAHQMRKEHPKIKYSEMLSSFATGFVAGMGFYVASLIPGFNKAYDLGMTAGDSILLSTLVYMATFTATFGNYMYKSIEEYDERQNPGTGRVFRVIYPEIKKPVRSEPLLQDTTVQMRQLLN
jgi:hypothetical protein